MSFLNPAFLGALALVGVPLLIHLIRRRRLKVIQWAAMEFLRQSQKKQRKRLRIEELILLLLRMLIVACAVLAFARPVLQALGVPLLSQNARVYAVIVLDNSFSMAHVSPTDNKSSWDRAQAQAEQLLTKVLRQGDSVSVVLLSDKTENAVGAPSYDLTLVRQRVKAAKIGDRGTDYLQAAQAVEKLLKASKAPNKEVYWITDDQVGAWKSSKREVAHAVWQEVGKQARVTWLSVGAPANARDNLAVEAPVLSRELVTPQLPARVESRIFNYSGKSRDDLLVKLFVDGKPDTPVRISIPPHGMTVASFTPRFTRPGPHTGRIELSDPTHVDGLAKDNGADFAVRARDRIKVLVQDMRPTSDPTRSDSFYLLNAMAPNGEAESLAPKLREGEGLGGADLKGYDCVILAGISGLSSGDQRVLSDYVNGGGGVLIFPGVATDAGRVTRDLTQAGLLPAKIGPRKRLPEEEGLSLNSGSITRAPLLLFKDTSLLNIGTARFTLVYPLEPAQDTNDPNAVRTLARFSNSDPAFVERRIGRGKVILAASTAGAAGNQLPLKPSYVPLIYQLVSYLGEGAASHRNLKQDETFSLPLPLADANKSVRVTLPDGKVTAQNTKLEASGVTFSFSDTRQAGLYKLSVEGGKTQDAFAVNVPAAESDLTPADPRQSITDAGLPAGRLTVAASPQELEASVRRSRYGAEAWRPLIWLVIPLLFLESLLAQLFGRRG